jgi:hypothetical protein
VSFQGSSTGWSSSRWSSSDNWPSRRANDRDVPDTGRTSSALRWPFQALISDERSASAAAVLNALTSGSRPLATSRYIEGSDIGDSSMASLRCTHRGSIGVCVIPSLLKW